MATMTPRSSALAAEASATTTSGPDERFSGYTVMGLPFASGHYLAFRRFPQTPWDAYTTVWHRDPGGRWTIWTDQPADRSCPRYFDRAIDASARTGITVTWTGEHELEVQAGPIRWRMTLAARPATALMSAMARRMPARAWRSTPVLTLMGPMARLMLGTGRMRLTGIAPNGQWFQAAPTAIWDIPSSTATIDGADAGPLGPLSTPARLGDLWLPQRGLFTAAGSRFAAFDPVEHVAARPALDAVPS
jgi:hypothetical protein